ncbi:hypothetical protein HK100_006052, partial [Physocladia obscura]
DSVAGISVANAKSADANWALQINKATTLVSASTRIETWVATGGTQSDNWGTPPPTTNGWDGNPLPPSNPISSSTVPVLQTQSSAFSSNSTWTSNNTLNHKASFNTPAPNGNWTASPSATAVSGGWGNIQTLSNHESSPNGWDSGASSAKSDPWSSVPGSASTKDSSTSSQPNSQNIGWNSSQSKNDGWGAVPGVNISSFSSDRGLNKQTNSQPPTVATNWGAVQTSAPSKPESQPLPQTWSQLGSGASLKHQAFIRQESSAQAQNNSNWESPVVRKSQSAHWGLSGSGWNNVSAPQQQWTNPNVTSNQQSKNMSGWGAIADSPTAKNSGNGNDWNSVPVTPIAANNWANAYEANQKISMHVPQQQQQQKSGWNSNNNNNNNNNNGSSSINQSPNSGGWNATPPHPHTPLSTSRSEVSQQQQQYQIHGWGPTPTQSPVAASQQGPQQSNGTGGWNSNNDLTVAGNGSPARPAKGSGGIGGWNPQGWTNGTPPPASGYPTGFKPTNNGPAIPKGPPVTGSSEDEWGIGVGGRVASFAEADAKNGSVGKPGIIGGGFRRAKSTADIGAKRLNSSIGSGMGDGNGEHEGPTRLFVKSFADINSEKPVKDDFSSAIGIFVYGLPISFKIKEILGIFGEFGDVVNVRLNPKSATNPRSYAHIEYEVSGGAAKAIQATHGKTVTASSDPLEVIPDFGGKNIPTGPAAVKTVTEPNSSGNPKQLGSQQQSQPTGSWRDEAANSDNRTLHIANAPLNVEKTDVEKVFGRNADIRFINVVPRPKEKRSMIFITFKTSTAATKALGIAKTGRHFSMTEPLKIEFSRAETRNTAPATALNGTTPPGSASTPTSVSTGSISTLSVTKKKSESFKVEKKKQPNGNAGSAGGGKETGGGKSVEKKLSSASIVSNMSGSGGGGKKFPRPNLFVRDIAEDATNESVIQIFEKIGPVSACHIVERLDGSGARYGLVVFQSGEDAARAVRDKIENAVYPRQRRLTVTKLRKDISEAQVQKAFGVYGEVKRVEIVDSNETDTFVNAEIEYARGDAAILAHIHLIEHKIGAIGADAAGGYSTSIALVGGQNAETDEKAVVPLPPTVVTTLVESAAFSASDAVFGGGNDGKQNHDSAFENEEVIKLADLT